MISKLLGRHSWATLVSGVAAIIIAAGVWLLGWSNVGHWFHLHRDSLELLIWIVDVVAFGLAVMFLFHLKGITKSLSTRFIGRFPDNLDAITDLVRAIISLTNQAKKRTF